MAENRKGKAKIKKGKVKGIGAGEATITASNGKKSVSCLVTVKEVHLHRTKRTVKVGDEFKLKLKCGAKKGITSTSAV